eukprot:CAMPEP_0118855580 /NCGR_PEP_ID=MMETSP1163-20130328/3350_1 /TAXON_ID=124430 /ORGANISM="Phaeomonas parva, Strain CCMP2877" /LENGTH=439 /DNA_ID=CAMNT_0006788491 /DNA_START=120 /DNA_END=1440 /DNA_ORIENTATION=-
MPPRKTKREMERQANGVAGSGAAVHDDFMKLFQDKPVLGDIAREVGIIKNKEIPQLRGAPQGWSPSPFAVPAGSLNPPTPVAVNSAMLKPGTPGMAAGYPNAATGAGPVGVTPSMLAGAYPAATSVNAAAAAVAAAANVPPLYRNISVPAPDGVAQHPLGMATRPLGMAYGDLVPNGPGMGGMKRMGGGGGMVGDLAKTKGLRHFSMRVCKKVEEKGTTTYNEVAEELVMEYKRETEAARNAAAVGAPGVAPSPPAKPQKVYDEKNIRRRVYDALNVLMAMDIISKEKKQIKWRGLPTNARQDLERLRREKDARLRSIGLKREKLQEHLVQFLSFDNIAARNTERERTAAAGQEAPVDKLDLPFIIVTTSQQTMIQCEMAQNRESVFFNFDGAFEVHDDMEIIKRLDLHTGVSESAAKQLPPAMLEYMPKRDVKRQRTA